MGVFIEAIYDKLDGGLFVVDVWKRRLQHYFAKFSVLVDVILNLCARFELEMRCAAAEVRFRVLWWNSGQFVLEELI